MTALAVPYVVRMRLNFNKKSKLLHFGNDLFPCLVAIKPRKTPRLFVHRSVVVHYADHGKIFPKPHFEIVGIVRWRNLDRSRSEFGIDVIVGDNGNFTVRQGQRQHFAHKRSITLVRRVHGDRSVSQHRFGTGRRNRDFFVRTLYGISKIPKITFVLGIFHLDVGKSGLTLRTHVDNTTSTINKPLMIKIEKRRAYCLGAFFIHCKSKARPIAGATELFKLFDNSSVLFFPCPGTFQELLPAEFFLCNTLFLSELFTDFDFRCKRGVIRSGQPQCGIALHTFEADNRILQRLVHCVPHMKLTRHVRGRHHYRKRNFLLIDFGTEQPLFHPIRINAFLKILWIVGRIHFFHISTFVQRKKNYTTEFLRCQLKRARHKIYYPKFLYGVFT